MLEKTKGIVLRVVKYRNTSAIIDILTENYGLKTYLINGVFKKKPSFPPSAIQLGVVLNLVVYNREGKSINRIKELKFSWHPNKGLFDIKRIAVKMFIIELSRKIINYEHESLEIFELLNSILKHIEYSEESVANIPIFYFISFFKHLGITPDLSQYPNKKILNIEEGILVSEIAPNLEFIPALHVQIIVNLAKSQLNNVNLIKLKNHERQEVTMYLTKYFRHHIDNFPQLYTPDIYKRLL